MSAPSLPRESTKSLTTNLMMTRINILMDVRKVACVKITEIKCSIKPKQEMML